MKEIIGIVIETLKIMIFAVKPVIDKIQDHPYFKAIALPSTIAATIAGAMAIARKLSRRKKR